jgi:hypothetical protein
MKKIIKYFKYTNCHSEAKPKNLREKKGFRCNVDPSLHSGWQEGLKMTKRAQDDKKEKTQNNKKTGDGLWVRV